MGQSCQGGQPLPKSVHLCLELPLRRQCSGAQGTGWRNLQETAHTEACRHNVDSQRTAFAVTFEDSTQIGKDKTHLVQFETFGEDPL